MKPPSYRILNACANCKHVFVREEYDEKDEHYCALDAPARPPCMSLKMEECDYPTTKDGRQSFFIDRENTSGEYEEKEAAWNAWREGREVAANGVCDCWAAKP